MVISELWTERRRMDDRGVVAIAGLTMALFLTAVMYYQIGVGDAITFKEQLQDASDASGFASAVYHARGMNMIVDLNLIMAAVLAIIVTLSLIQLMLGVAVVVAAALAIVYPPAAGWAAMFGGWEGAVSEAKEDVIPIVKAALQGLNDVETAVAVGMPWVAAIKSVSVGSIYYPTATTKTGGGTLALSVSLAPDMTFIPAASKAGDSALNSLQSATITKLKTEPICTGALDGKRFGLPVDEGEFDMLCDYAGQFIPTLIESAITAIVEKKKNGTSASQESSPAGLSWLNTFIGAAVATFAPLLCAQEELSPEPEVCHPDVAGTAQKAAQQACDAGQKSFNECLLTVNDSALPFASTSPDDDPSCTSKLGDSTILQLVQAAQKKNSKSPTFDMTDCMSDQTKDLTDEANNQAGELKEATTPMNVYGWAANGNDYMAVWSFSWGEYSNSVAAGISVAEWLKGSAIPAQSQHVTMLTKAEFYYAVENPCEGDAAGQDQGTKSSSALCNTPALAYPFWGDYAADTMWNPRWVARLRRVSPPMIPLGQIADSGITTLGSSVLKTVESKAGGGAAAKSGAGIFDWFNDFVTGWFQLGTGAADSEISGAIEKAAGYDH